MACYTSRSQRPRKYLRCSSTSVPCVQALGYTVGKTLGSGAYAKVKSAWSPFERQMVAIKIIDKAKVDEEDLAKYIPGEINILQKVSHPNIIGIYQIVETERRCFFVTEIAENGSLLDYMMSRHSNILEPEGRYVFNQICQAISYCHSFGIAHRDIKLANIFFDKNMDVKVGDFGYALESKNKLCSTPVGTLSYKAPEMVLSLVPEFDPFKADSWSMGVLLYTFVKGCYPFGGKDQVLNNHLWHYENLQLGSGQTEEFNSLVKCLLTVDMTVRPLVSDICSHIWLTGYPSIRPFWTGVPGDSKFTIEKSLPSAFCNIKPRHLCTSQSPLCSTTLPPYPQSQSIQEDRQADITEEINDVKCAEVTGEQRCDQMGEDSFLLTNDIELSSASSESSTHSVVSVHVYETAEPVEAEYGRLVYADSPSINALSMTASQQQGQGRRHILTRMRSAGRRVISFFRRIKKAKSSS